MRQPPRRLGLLDLMILVGSLARGLTWARFQADIPGHLFNPMAAFSGAFSPDRWGRAVGVSWIVAFMLRFAAGGD